MYINEVAHWRQSMLRSSTGTFLVGLDYARMQEQVFQWFQDLLL